MSTATTSALPNIPPPLNIITSHGSAFKGRGRSGSIVAVQEVGGDQQDFLDQSAYRNLNAEWVNGKGAWLIHPLLILTAKLLVDSIPGIHQNASWTIVNLSYMAISYIMFHYVTGVPFESETHGGAYDDLTMWEQIDEGAQYTPAKKWLVCTPIVLFLVSTHYTNYHPWAFAINFSALVFVLLAKLPQFHRQRLRFMPPPESGLATPVTPYPPSLPGSRPSTPRL